MDKIQSLNRSYQTAGLYTHAYLACGFLDADDLVYEQSFLPDGRDVFDLSSLTKALSTTSLILTNCFDAGRDPTKTTVCSLYGQDVCGDFGQSICDLTVASFLRHETGLPAWRNLYVECEGRRQTLLEAVARATDPTTASDVIKHQELYSDVGFMLLGEFLSRRAQKGLQNLWQEFMERIKMPKGAKLGPSNTIFPKDAVPTAYCPIRQRELVGEVHDENAWALGGFSGHSGLFGSGSAVSKFIQRLWKDGAGRKIIEANFAEANSTGDSLLGWRKGRDQSAKTFANGRGCGHLGFTGTAFWVDPQTKSFAVVLTNRVISGRIPLAIKQMRAESFAALWELLTRAT